MIKHIFYYALAVLIFCCSVFGYDYNYEFDFGNKSKVQWIDLLPQLSWSPESKAFGNHSTGTSTRQIFTLANSGNDIAEDVAVSLTGTGFRLYSTTTFGNISAGESRIAKVEFKPTTAGAFTGYLNYSAPNIAKVAANLTGVGVSSGVWVTDDFERADAATLGSNWNKYASATWLQIVSGKAAKVAAADGPFAWWAANAIGNDQCSQVTLSNTSGDLDGRPIVRSSTTAWQNYFARPVSNAVYLYRMDGIYTTTSLGSYSHTPAIGDVIRICAEGSNITVRINGTIRVTKTDATYLTGKVGIIGVAAGATVATWAGGDLGAAP